MQLMRSRTIRTGASWLPVAVRLALLAFILGTIPLPARAAESMPDDFVYLRDVDLGIAQDMRYAWPFNFTGAKVPGYAAPECVLLRPAAEALARVQVALAAKGLALKVYDCYRPAHAVSAFVGWAKAPDDPKAKQSYYPHLPKAALFPDYIATRSGHSRGATLDVTLIPLDVKPVSDAKATPGNCTLPQAGKAPDGSLAMGTSFDCFDTKANTAASGLSDEERKTRSTLVEAMRTEGFENYAMEWWHFTLKPEPHPDTYFDFPILPRTGH